jgi:hypothetical protein
LNVRKEFSIADFRTSNVDLRNLLAKSLLSGLGLGNQGVLTGLGQTGLMGGTQHGPQQFFVGSNGVQQVEVQLEQGNHGATLGHPGLPAGAFGGLMGHVEVEKRVEIPVYKNVQVSC